MSAAQEKELVLWDVASGREILALRGLDSHALAVTFSPDGSRLAARLADGTVQLWDGRPWDDKR